MEKPARESRAGIRQQGRAYPAPMEVRMTLCPIAVVAGCEKCPAFKICPLKGVIGSPPKQDTARKAAPKKAAGRK